MIKKNFGNHVSAKVLVSRTYKKVLQLSKMTNNPILKCVKNRHSSKKIYKWPISKWKYVQHHYPLANKTQWDCCHDGYNHKGKIISNADNNAKKTGTIAHCCLKWTMIWPVWKGIWQSLKKPHTSTQNFYSNVHRSITYNSQKNRLIYDK